MLEIIDWQRRSWWWWFSWHTNFTFWYITDFAALCFPSSILNDKQGLFWWFSRYSQIIAKYFIYKITAFQNKAKIVSEIIQNSEKIFANKWKFPKSNESEKRCGNQKLEWLRNYACISSKRISSSAWISYPKHTATKSRILLGKRSVMFMSRKVDELLSKKPSCSDAFHMEVFTYFDLLKKMRCNKN